MFRTVGLKGAGSLVALRLGVGGWTKLVQDGLGMSSSIRLSGKASSLSAKRDWTSNYYLPGGLITYLIPVAYFCGRKHSSFKASCV